MSNWLDAAVAATGQMLGSATSLTTTKKAYKANKKLLQQQNDFNYRMWQEANAYNAPSQQVQRLRDAGINPVSAYGNITSTSPTVARAASTPSMQAYTGFGDMGASSALSANE